MLAALNLAYQLAERPSKPATRGKDGSAPADSVQIDTMLARIEAALGHDGQLL